MTRILRAVELDENNRPAFKLDPEQRAALEVVIASPKGYQKVERIEGFKEAYALTLSGTRAEVPMRVAILARSRTAEVAR